MAWQKGQSGNPAGRACEKPWRDALTRALGGKHLVDLKAVADVVVKLALAGDMAAIKEIGDRLDGRPKQQTEVSGADGGPLTIILRDLAAERRGSDNPTE